MAKTIRLRKGIRTTGIICLLGFLAMGTFSVAATILAPSPNARLQPVYMAMAFGFFWGAMASLAFWLLLTYWRGRLIVFDDGLTQQGVLHTEAIRFDEIERIVWKSAPPQVRLHTPSSRLKIDLSDFAIADRLWLIRHMGEVQQPAHEGWEMFCVKVAVPLQQSEIHDGQTLGPDKVALTRKRWAYYFLPTTLLFAVIGFVLSWALQKPQMFAAPLPILILWAVLHFRTPQQGMPTTRICSESGTGSYLRFVLVWCVIGLAASSLLSALKLPMPQMIAWGVGGGILWFSVLIYRAVQLDRHCQQRDEDRIPAALEEWTGKGMMQDRTV